MMIITISGLPGTGTSTLARHLSKELKIPWVNSGELFRNIAAERGVSLAELGRSAEAGPEIDYLIDDAQRAQAAKSGGVFEGRLSGHILDADLKILLKTDKMVRAERIAAREKKLVEDALRESRVREESEARRYEKYYNIDINDSSVYDLVIDTGTWDETGVVAIVLAAVRSIGDERKTAV
ncbi:(d)CMP kinase [Candidatus Methanocrinis natronophilus]|uniref:Cytidylate kinase n=1 Tax=Candidatus Methanocrinis natronophilus TaxID=3033396 RepID=A0ABT5X882_9EURY|nr:AAA family ATPase [Candidatus Methanocrinis natronophilus]MDF0590910.1 AAA family ATPase [Candidatus Methanocrinis natronophilus]